MVPPNALPLFLRVAEVAAILSMPTSWVYSQCRLFSESRGREGIPCKHFGRAVRVPRDRLMEYLEG